jgi:hypothetical protein
MKFKMKLVIAFVAAVFLALAASATAMAGTPSGATTPLAPGPISGTTLSVDASVKDSVFPAVPFGYAIQNECFFSGRTSGRPDAIQHDDIVYWTSFDANGAHAIMPVYLQSIPAGSACKVFLVKNNTVVKGSTTSYKVN